LCTITHKPQIIRPIIINNKGIILHFSDIKPTVKPAAKKNGPNQNTSFQSLFLFIREQKIGNRFERSLTTNN
ncbi:MAG: hypothetical protein ACK5RD_17290, partial [Aphanizomenon sp.]